jgi:hypothetical protein
MLNLQEEVSFSVPDGWVVDKKVPMGIRHQATDATFAVFFDELVPLVGDILRVQGTNVAPDIHMAFDMHKRALRDSLGSQYILIREGRRQIGRVRFREIVVETTQTDQEKRHVRDFVTWYRSRAYVLRWTVPAARAGESDRYLDKILSSLDLKARD